MLCALGVLPFRRAGTTVDPTRPDRASALVTTGVYSMTRNPMYLGMLLVIVAWGLYLANAVGLLRDRWRSCCTSTACRFRAKSARWPAAFGSDYAGYASRVRRWL